MIDNALRYTPEDGKVRVSVIEDANAAQLVVEDSGPGIAEPERSRVFDRFYRAAATRALPGSGLGLAIVKQFANDHGATVSVSDTQGGGATITIQFA